MDLKLKDSFQSLQQPLFEYSSLVWSRLSWYIGTRLVVSLAGTLCLCMFFQLVNFAIRNKFWRSSTKTPSCFINADSGECYYKFSLTETWIVLVPIFRLNKRPSLSQKLVLWFLTIAMVVLICIVLLHNLNLLSYTLTTREASNPIDGAKHSIYASVIYSWWYLK